MRGVDVPTIVTGVVITGFAAVIAWVGSGQGLLGPTKLWFAGIPMVAGSIGLMISLGRSPRGKETTANRRRK